MLLEAAPPADPFQTSLFPGNTPPDYAPPQDAPIAQPRLLPEPVAPTVPRNDGRDAAIDFDAYRNRQTPEAQQILDDAIRSNPKILAQRLADVLFISDETHVPAQYVLEDFSNIRDSYAAGNRWNDAIGNDDAVHAKIVAKATKQRDHEVTLIGMDGDNETARKAREQSAVNRGYMAGIGTSGTGTGGFDAGVTGLFPTETAPGQAQATAGFNESLLDGFARYEKTHPKLDPDPRARSERFQAFSANYARGKADLAVASMAASKALPAFLEGGNVRDAIPFLRDLTPRQLALAVTRITGAAQGLQGEEKGTLGKTAEVAGRATKRLMEGISRYMESRDDRTFKAGDIVSGTALEKGIGSAVDESIAGEGGDPVLNAMFPQLPENPVRLTAAQAKEANAYVEQKKADRNLLFRIKQIADGTVNPLAPDTILQGALLKPAEAVPAMATAMIPVVGPVAVGMAFASDGTEALIAQGVNRGTAEMLGTIAGAIQGLGMRFSAGFLVKSPAVNEMIGKFSTNAMVRMMQRVGIGGAEAAATTALTMTTVPMISQKIAREFDATVPGHTWGEIMKESWATAGNAMFDFLPIVFMGSGFAHYSDIRGAKEVAQDPAKMRALGFEEKDIAAVMAGTGDKDTAAALVQGFARRKPILPGDSRATSLTEAATMTRNVRPEDYPPGTPVPPEVAAVDAEEQARAAAQEAGVTVSRDEDGWKVGEVGKDGTKVGDDAANALEARDALTREKQAEENAGFAEKMDKAEKEAAETSPTKEGETPSEPATSPSEEEAAPIPEDHGGREIPEIDVAGPGATMEDASPVSAATATDRTSPEGASGTKREPSSAESGNRGNTTHAELEATAKEFGVEIPKGEKWKVPDELAKAKAIVDADPRAGEKLVNELKKKPRVLDVVERLVINHEEIRRKREMRDAIAHLNSDTLPESERESAQARFEAADDAMQEFLEHVWEANRRTGSAMRAIGVAQAADFSQEGMRAYVRAKYNKGQKFEGKRGKEMEKKVEELHAKIAKAAKDLAESRAQTAKAEADVQSAKDAAAAKEANEAQAAEEKKQPQPRVRRTIAGLEKIIEADRARMKELSGKLGSGGYLPEAIFRTARIAAFLAAKHGLKGAELAARVIKEVGEWAKDHIKAIMDLAATMEISKESDLVKEVGTKTAQGEDFQKRVQEAADKAAKEASDKLIKEVGSEAAKGEAFQRRLERRAQEAADAARKKASDELIAEAGKRAAEEEGASPEAFQKRLEAEAKKAVEQEARAVENYKKAVQKRIAEVQAKTAKGDFTPAEKKAKALRDKETTELLAKYNGAVLEYERAKKRWEYENRSKSQKAFDTVIAAKMGAILLSFKVVGKLATAAVELIAGTIAEGASGAWLAKVPGLRQVAAKSPRHRKFSVAVEAQAIADVVTNFMGDVKSIAKHGKTEYELRYGDGEKVRTGGMMNEVLGRFHAILKTAAARQEFSRSFAYRAIHESKRGVDVSSEEIQARIAIESLTKIKEDEIGTKAALDAGAAVFKTENAASDWKRDTVARLKRTAAEREKAGNDPGAAVSRALAFLLEYNVPIVRIPTNIFLRGMEHAFGSFTGGWRLYRGIKAGLDNLTPEQADMIMQNLKRGQIGLAVLALGFFNPGNVGGYYQRGQHPGEGEPDFGELIVFGYKLPKWAIHNPLLEMLQLGATIRRIYDQKVSKHSEETKTAGEAIYAGILGMAEEQPFINELGRLADTMKNPGEFFGEMLKSAIPGVIQQGAQWMDPNEGKKDRKGAPIRRKPEDWLETISMGIPGLRNTVPTAEERKRMRRQ